ncbi:MAG TPA: FAD:protein FMN transferase [Zeimonas sp.]|nr:FAD:protein FMN transferase [Zeimonas sp.]
MTNRRRFVSIVAACAAATPFSSGSALAAAAPAVSVWKGTAMGALATMTLVHPDRAMAQALIARCVVEIDRLESVFSLYRSDSALSRLNAAGQLLEPPHELVELLSMALGLARLSDGAFDPTVQPLYRLYADHFASPGAAAAGPSPQALAATLRSVDFSAVEMRADRIRLRRPAMAITLNGIAQGFVTDRVADMLRTAGLEGVLVDLGEVRALGHRPDGRPWRAAIGDPLHRDRTLFELPLGDRGGSLPALATSSGRGTSFGPDPRIHHLFDPRTGRSANYHASVSVAAPRAALADGLSTALSVLDPARAGALLAGYPSTRAWLVDANGRVDVLSGR